ncbi:MAG: hypothetical protein JWP19_291 [Rhodoglobus sp.]|nr:hypothetical protein [Rhodoglobus sp.]
MAIPAQARSRRFRLLWILPAAVLLLAVAVLLARFVRELPAVQDFMTQYPGESELPPESPVGLPAWLGWQHFLSAFFILLIIRTGWQIRTEKRPAAFYTRNNRGLIRTKGAPHRISLTLWLHLSLDALWVLNGVVFIVLVFVSGHWVRLVPLHWDIFPNAVSVGIQYLSLQWPTENGWVNYNALQLLTYFITVFIAAPLAILTGIRMSPAWPTGRTRLSAAYPVELARRIHFPVMLWFVLFTVTHVTLVFATGALRNLNHMYAGRDDASWWGFGIFAASLLVMIAAWFLARPLFLRPIAALSGTVSR